MDLMPWQAVVFISIPEAFLMNLMGLTLVGVRPDLKKLGIVAILQALCSYFIRALPIVYGGTYGNAVCYHFYPDKNGIEIQMDNGVIRSTCRYCSVYWHNRSFICSFAGKIRAAQ